MKVQGVKPKRERGRTLISERDELSSMFVVRNVDQKLGCKMDGYDNGCHSFYWLDSYGADDGGGAREFKNTT